MFDEKELASDRTVAKYATVQIEGKREVSREIEFYNLDVIIAVGTIRLTHLPRASNFREFSFCENPRLVPKVRLTRRREGAKRRGKRGII